MPHGTDPNGPVFAMAPESRMMHGRTPEPNKRGSAYERAALQSVDERCVPIQLNGPVPEGESIPYADYADTDHETWALLYGRQTKFCSKRPARSTSTVCG